jgi:hypothetical protein
VIQHTHIDQRQGGCDAFRDHLVRVGLILYPAGVAVQQEARCGSLLDHQLHYFAGIDSATCDRSAEELNVLNYAVTLIDQDDRENFLIEMSEPHRQILAHFLRRTERRSPAHSVCQRLAGRRQDLLG